MALVFFGQTRCPLCEQVILESDDFVATSHFIHDKSDPLWTFSDAAIHRACFLGWTRREAFVARYNATVGGLTWGSGTYHDMQPDGTIIGKIRPTT